MKTMKNNIISVIQRNEVTKNLGNSHLMSPRSFATLWMTILMLTLAACSEEEFIAPQGMHEDGLHIAAVTIDGQDVARSRATTDDGGTYTTLVGNLPLNQSITELTAGDGLVLTYHFGGGYKYAYATLGTDGTWTMTDVDTGNPITIAPDKENGEKWADAYMYAQISGNDIVGSDAGYADVAEGLGVVQGDIPVDNKTWILVDWLDACTDANEQQAYDNGPITIDTDVKSPTLGAATITFKHQNALLRLPKTAVSVAKDTYIVDGTAYRVTGLGTLWTVVEYDGTTCYHPLTEVGDNLQAIVNADVNGYHTLIGFKAVLNTDGGGTLTLDLPFTVGDEEAASSGIAMMPNTCYPLTLTIAPNRSSVTLTSLGKPGWDDNDENTLSNFLNEVEFTDVDGVPYVNLDGTATSVDDVKSTIQAVVANGYYNFYVKGELEDYPDYELNTNAKSVVGEAIRTSGAGNGTISLVLGEATSIGDEAFYNCRSLASLSLPAATSIGGYAFYNCFALKSVTADEAETIGKSAFSNCSSLTSLTFGSVITSVGTEPFYGANTTNCDLTLAEGQQNSTSLAPDRNTWADKEWKSVSILIDGVKYVLIDGQLYRMIDGELYRMIMIDGEKYLEIDGTADYETVSPIVNAAVTAGCYNFYVKGTTLAGYSGNFAKTAVGEAIRTSGAADGTISLVLAEATSIGDKAFLYCKKLTSVTADEAERIGDGAFDSCSSLTSVTADEAETIKLQAFQYCTSLTSVSLPLATSIGNEAFQYCTSLTSVSLPAATTIEGYAFRSCTSLTSVSLPDATSIEHDAFWHCTSLTSLTFGSVINSVGTNAFGDANTKNCDLTLANGQASHETYPATAGENVNWAGYEWKSVTLNTTDE